MSVMSLEELVELKFRLHDGTDIGPNRYAPTTTVANMKESILNQWPKEKQNGPKSINDLKLINAGKILENTKTLADSRVLLGEIPGCVITMHVVVRPPSNDKASEKQQSETPNSENCCCTIL
ncbi:membrane-anchored ubiquitin-fold protein 3 isoform X2 [Physcomitrium patens]|uniref:Membrane-anchored ubiquitin-fold protein n=1 Tax=Physcomitrium patens TaxID=3218 RepID=A0A2K1KKI4_PHYPA|nr:membrane-anchored ubiquitin-fold protein 3-like [Physcomitrium patens]XP_024375745.1 membrane-anchored ubiquitin-fold protein 3-like [Physcomitrium patens]XP_024375746.1 membrane-anchored ubiquitin-fold protein 3-like [Physcomitrium patens]XP_024375747.1 membrane-anchored ubiquitin-fold protein 3-like [Physcomitrium patens]XP_024375748.1 membrane-anchored ubiquitin-fold protein 3-like [Physcomitrium patens]XP_024375749.1 membrane-anchored ubiquitin-fold protein 3-like [Physcomitrium patens]|eukprot:XP_024375744.1 membrane-anchored ubiquitin-fold protein 3-like [Physcomitrella patens]